LFYIVLLTKAYLLKFVKYRNASLCYRVIAGDVGGGDSAFFHNANSI